MHPSSLLSYYPTYAILDEIVSFGDYKKLNIFIDLKNVLQTTYMKHAIENIIDSSKKSRYLDTSVFSAVISFLSLNKIYGMKRGIEDQSVGYPPRYLQGDQKGADSNRHAQFIDGYVVGYF